MKTVTTEFARPEGTRRMLHAASVWLQTLIETVDMPNDFAIKARNLIVEMENEGNRTI